MIKFAWKLAASQNIVSVVCIKSDAKCREHHIPGMASADDEGPAWIGSRTRSSQRRHLGGFHEVARNHSARHARRIAKSGGSVTMMGRGRIK